MDSTERLLVDGYVYGYPLVVNLSSIQAIAEHGMGEALPAPGWNGFAFATRLATPDHPFVSVNNDTLYAIAFLDLSGGPLRLRVPDTDGAYTVLQFVDAWTNNFAYVGRRATGTGAGEFLVVPPGWAGDAPSDARTIESPTMVAAIVGRLAIDGEDDLPRVQRIQAGLALEPLPGNGPLSGIPHGHVATLPEHLRPWELLRVWSQAFPPSAPDREYLRRFAPYGLADRHDPYGIVTRELDAHLAHAAAEGRNRIEELSRPDPSAAVNGWNLLVHAFDYNLDHLGIGTIDTPEWRIADRAQAYETRARSARNGLWGNHGYEAVYGEVFVDSDGRELDGAHAYELRLDEDPPAEAFWSITMYSMPDFLLVENPIRRYSLGDRTPGLVRGADGSLVIRMQRVRPDDEAVAANWLPAPEGRFRPMVRIYQPDAAVLDGAFRMPAITRLD